MNYCRKLRGLIKAKRIKLHLVLGPPRTRATAIHLALTQAPEIDGQLDEPFSLAETLEESCYSILKRAEKIKKETVELIIHDKFAFISEKRWLRIINLAENLIIVLREPRLQYYSELKILASGNKMNFETSKLIPSRWRYIESLFEKIKNKRFCLIDSEKMFKNPKRTLQKLTKHLNGISYCDQMLGPWKKGVGKHYYHGFKKLKKITFQYWKKDFLKSGFLKNEVSKPPPLKAFPLKAHSHLIAATLLYRSILKEMAVRDGCGCGYISRNSYPRSLK